MTQHASPANAAPIDRIDQKILRLLQSDGRMGNADIAKRVNVSPATCHRRMQRLFEEGYITSIRAQIAPDKVDRAALVMVGVVLDRSTPDSFAAFETAFLKIRVRDMVDFNHLHGDQLIALPGVRQTRTFFVMKEVVDNAPLAF